jgi:hypothetical protein
MGRHVEPEATSARSLQSTTEYYRVLQSTTEYYRILHTTGKRIPPEPHLPGTRPRLPTGAPTVVAVHCAVCADRALVSLCKNGSMDGRFDPILARPPRSNSLLCYSMSCRVAACRAVSQHAVQCCSMPCRVATCRAVSQHAVPCCSIYKAPVAPLQHVVLRCSMLYGPSSLADSVATL